jgi:hypothetical protein
MPNLVVVGHKNIKVERSNAIQNTKDKELNTRVLLSLPKILIPKPQ